MKVRWCRQHDGDKTWLTPPDMKDKRQEKKDQNRGYKSFTRTDLNSSSLGPSLGARTSMEGARGSVSTVGFMLMSTFRMYPMSTKD